MGSEKFHKLPIIEFTKENLMYGTESWSKACNAVISALEEYGCFVALYDKITPEIHENLFHVLEELFELPAEIKAKNKSSKPFHGYNGPNPFLPLYESTAIGNASLPEGVQSFTDLMWPNGNDQFSKTLLQYTKWAAELEKIIVRMVFEGYGVGKYYENLINSCTHLCRVMKYKGHDSNDKKTGFMPHTDKNFITTIHQINQVNGLEIQAKDGEWFGVEFSPLSIVVMAGDAFMAWSNDRIKSTFHRVSMEGKETRYSIAQFSTVDGVVLQTPEELINDEHPLKYKPFDHPKFLEFISKQDKLRFESAIKAYCGV